MPIHGHADIDRAWSLQFGMVFFVRRFAASLGTVGLIGSICVYAASFAGLTIGSVTNAHPWLFIFFGGIILLYIPVVVIEYNGPSWERQFFLERLCENPFTLDSRGDQSFGSFRHHPFHSIFGSYPWLFAGNREWLVCLE